MVRKLKIPRELLKSDKVCEFGSIDTIIDNNFHNLV
jgi:hypothetical protein